MTTAAYMRDLAQRCRYWSQNCFDLSAAREFRMLAEDLESTAKKMADDGKQKRHEEG